MEEITHLQLERNCILVRIVDDKDTMVTFVELRSIRELRLARPGQPKSRNQLTDGF